MRSTIIGFAGFIFVIVISLGHSAEEKKTHLFILSGQSNMGLLNPRTAFIPTVEKEFGKENVIVVKVAKGGKPIRCWYKAYSYPQGHPRAGRKEKRFGWMYDKMMDGVNDAIAGKTFDTVTFIWMQGEAYAEDDLADSYEEAFKGTLAQLKKDLNIDSLNFVIGRISDYGLLNPRGMKKKDSWITLRNIQVKMAEDDANGEWVDCDDLNKVFDKRTQKVIENGLHMSPEGYRKMGKRFAQKAIALINGTVEKKN
ncbi:hypothetical protein BVX99_02255 [bacterium F16]|nr:hypothetical protein BVX99_02255 [bacterium F16]